MSVETIGCEVEPASEASNDRAGVAIFPPLLFLIVLMVVAGLQWIVSIPWPWAGSSRWIGVSMIVAAVVLALWARVRFDRAGTNVNPRRPSTALVLHGPYRFTRNPMYLGMLIAVLGVGFAFRNIWALLLLPPFGLALHYLIIRREEAYLEAKFGDAYRAYRSRVRRWF
jgi:protein-S-isoprenylcysteine O-methyltransferase Ste14